MSTVPPGATVYSKRPLPARAEELPPFLTRELSIVERAVRDTRLQWIRFASADTSLGDADGMLVVDAGTAAVTVTLPDVLRFWGRTFIVKRNAASAHSVTVDGGAATIDGVATYVLLSAYESVTVVSNGTEWFVI